ncbi:MAG: tricorn protease, partial [Saprospiraceae bacterium]
MSIKRFTIWICISVISLTCIHHSMAQGFEGYYQFPDVHNDKIVFCAEGDIWTVTTSGGVAQRLTTHAENEQYPIFSPDGQSILFTASYEGPRELYTMPVNGGIPIRWTYERDASVATAWTSDNELVYATRAYNKKPDLRLVKIDIDSKERTHIPLDQASEASFDGAQNTMYFVRPADHRNVTKRYKGGTARQIWKFQDGTSEAVKLTKDYTGESHHPMVSGDRVYFISDRDGTMNIWSMNHEGVDVRQHTEHVDFDVRYANVHNTTIVYQRGADLWSYNISRDKSSKINITLASDLNQLKEKWEEKPARYITSVNPSSDGDKIAITARGRVFVMPVKKGRPVSFANKSNVRYRDATFSHDDKDLIALSDESGEFEFVTMSSDGLGEQKGITSDGDLLRYEGIPSSDGKWIAYDDLESNMYIADMATGGSTKVSTNQEGIRDFSWSPDNKWLAFVQAANNTMLQIVIYNVDTHSSFQLTTDRANSFNPRWSPDGQFIYFISDRSFTTLVGSPWGPRQPEPYFDASEKIYHIALQKNMRSPFRSSDELFSKKDKKDKEEGDVQVIIDQDGIKERIEAVPIIPGNYRNLAINNKALYLTSRETGVGAKSHLSFVKIGNEKVVLKTMVSDIYGFDLTGNGEKLLIRKGMNYYMCTAGTSKISSLNDSKIDLSGWKFPITPKEDWKQIFTDAWRMERDYFYDKNMHGVDWDRMHDKYLPLVDRVTTRNELSDLIGRFVGELSALHTSVRGGDMRSDDKNITVANLGGLFSRDETQGGFKIDYIYKTDPDYPDQKSPLDDPYLDVREGDVITHINGIESLSATDIGELIRNQESKQVRLGLKRKATDYEVIVEPIGSDYNLRYSDWEYGNRLYVDEQSKDDIGYLHLRAMGSNDISQFYREFYPVFDRRGLIIDMRYNFGGNIDSFILEKLLRKAWMFWKSRSGKPYWNMNYAFRGHIVVLVNENTYSDGEAFADGFRRLGLGVTIGTRTWGGEIWLSSRNRLSDNGLARAPMNGVYADGEWLIEGHGFEPDIELDNLPHASFNGQDAQLDRAIKHLQELIKEDPRDVPSPPAYPDKSFNNSK